MIKQGIHFEANGDVIRTNSNFVNGIASLPARVL